MARLSLHLSKYATLFESSCRGSFVLLSSDNVMVRNCLPAGLDVVLLVRIDQEPSCEPGVLFISVAYTVST